MTRQLQEAHDVDSVQARPVPSRTARPARTLLTVAVVVQAAALAVLLLSHDGGLARVGWLGVVAGVAWGTVTVVGRGPSRLTGAVCYLVGLAGVAVGIGIGMMHLVRSGDLADTVTGLMCLVAGLTQLLWGSFLLIRRLRRWQRPVAALAAAVVAFAVVFPSWQAVYATNVPRPALGSATPADVGLSYHDVEFSTPDGVRLSGWYIPSRNRAAVVLLHGAGSTRSAVLGQAAVLGHAGFGVLLFDARGHGRSGGQAMDFGWYGDEDVAGAVSYLLRRPDVDARRIGAVGMSMGGEEVIGAAASNTQIRVVVAEGATGRTAADLGWLSQRYGIRGSFTQAWDGLFTYRLADLLTRAAPPISLRDAVARAAPRPVLLITAGNLDDETQAARYIRTGSPQTVDIWRVPHAGHTRGLITRPIQWKRHVLGFLHSGLTQP